MSKKTEKKVDGFGERLKAEIEYGDGYDKVAYLTGISRTYLREIIRKDITSIYNLYKLCKVLNVSADYLLFGDEQIDWRPKPYMDNCPVCGQSLKGDMNDESRIWSAG